MSMISELVKELRNKASLLKTSLDEVYIGGDMLNRAADTIEMLSEKARGQAWIPCEERLPSEYGAYLTSSGKSVGLLHFGRCGWSGYGCGPDAWMPLPEPYMKGADNE